MSDYPRWRELLFESFEPFATDIPDPDPIGFPGYTEALAEARERSGAQEAAEAGIGNTGSHRVSAVLFDFSFMGGSMGIAVGDAVVAACERAVNDRLPMVIATSTGGARMQEGMAALAQMPRTVGAMAQVAEAGLPRIALLGHPTTGGVYASFATSCDFLIAQRAATIGFAGPRVAEAFTKKPIPEGSHTTEMAVQKGLVDAVVDLEQMRSALDDLLSILRPASPMSEDSDEGGAGLGAAGGADPWEAYQLARHPDRPSPTFYLKQMTNEIFWLSGLHETPTDPAVVAAVARIDGQPTMVIAFDRKSPTASGYRKARRAVAIASRLALPIVTMIDTPGADPSFDSEYQGLAGEISATFNDLLNAPVPVITITTGEGGSGGALALAVGDRNAIMRNAVFSVIAPEGAAAILHRDTTKAQEVAGQLKPTSEQLLELGLVDDVLEEPEGGAHNNPARAAREIRSWLLRAIGTTSPDPAGRAARYSDLTPRKRR